MDGYTHYSLFSDDHKTLAEFAAIPKGGLPELLRRLHGRTGASTNCCISVVGGTLHPDGQQVSFGVGKNGVEEFRLILMTRACVGEHASELAAEGNSRSAALAKQAIG